MKRLYILIAALIVPVPCLTASAGNGIFVAEPKLYDDYALEQMLIQAEQSLGALELIKSDTISSALGGLQGAQVDQTQFGLTANQVPTTQIANTQSATPSITTTTPSVIPGPGTPPNLPQVTAPSTFSTSAVDKINEFLQLKLRVSNLRLLLRGSLSDQVSLVGGEAVPQSRFTFGFPVTVETPANWRYRDAIAEVEVRVKLDENCAPSGSRPGLKMVLPQEKTYNVAQVRSSATSIGSGIISGVFSVGGNWLRGQSTHFLVQDQDTLAFEGSGSGNEIVFGWRFKPVLGKRKVQPSTQQVFAQLTFPTPLGAASLGTAKVVTRWRRYERKTGALAEPIPGTDKSIEFKLQRIDLAPGTVTTEFLDLGNGRVIVSLKPESAFFEGTSFRLGGSTTTEVQRSTDHVDLNLAPIDIVRQGLFVGVRGEKERVLVNACNDPGVPAALPPRCDAIPSVARAAQRLASITAARGRNPNISNAEALCFDRYSGFQITNVVTEAVGQSTTRVKLTVDKLRQPTQERDLKFLAILGDKVFGLRDAPYETYDPASGNIEFIVDNATLEKAKTVEVIHLLWGPDYHASRELYQAKKIVVAKHTTISEEGGLLLLLEGQGLDQAKIKFPTNAKINEQSATHALVFIPAADTGKLKQLVLQVGTSTPVLVDISKDTPLPAPLTPVLSPLDPVKTGTKVAVLITWKNEGEIKVVSCERQPQTILKSDKNSATVVLDDALTARPGKITLSILFKDGTELPLIVPLVDQHVAVVQVHG